MRARKLTFGDRIHCPFLRPFFLTEQDEARMRAAAETIAALGERVVRAALESAAVFDQLGLNEAETRLVRIDPGYRTSSTASRLDAFLLPDSLHFAEYNAESPAGLAYTQRLCELFDALPVMARFREGRSVRFNPTIAPMLDALLASYREWGGTADASDHGDRRLAERADLDRVRDPARRVRRGRDPDGRVRPARSRHSTARR